ncbi:hypothetical protein BU26DRAFT_594988 [Trematosphaeria pertusa]|uniref:Uncharacterized protein n=1 Tax=Trematosphaeria pertusa TaxID=390896 RepID=A0A6A6IGA8_9PLEO|nr:uncharacterized protein BU26DRAFT_594988 [Trematosphaeria pertusa]KAF2249239.1 hypothetical protein BU26DRAFT_594988 [Trematosphaeria pertusa]
MAPTPTSSGASNDVDGVKANHTSALNRAVVTIKPSKRNKNTNAQDQQLPDIRTMSGGDREWLTKGKPVRIFKGDSAPIADVAHRLLFATSTKAQELVNSNDEVHLPADVDKQSVLALIAELDRIIASKNRPTGRLASKKNAYKDLSICGTATLLGLDLYTSHLFNFYWARWREALPTYDEIDAVLKLPASQDHNSSLFNRIAKDLAIYLRGGDIEGMGEIDGFLAERPRLAKAIAEINLGHAEYLKRKQGREERKRKAEEARLRQEAMEKKKAEKEKDRRAKEKVRYEEERTNKAAIEKSIQEKMKVAGKKFTPEEVRHWMNTRGSRPPKGR